MTWPPLGWSDAEPYATDRDSETLCDPTHFEDHNNTNTALNELIKKVRARDAIKFISSAATTVTIDLSEARNYLLWVTDDIAQFNITNATPPSVGPNGDSLLDTSDFTVTVVFIEAGKEITWNLVNADGEGDPSFVVNWPYGVAPTLSNDLGKSHVLYFSNVYLGYNGYVIAEEMTQSVS